ncbi:hypothetical protein MMC07_000789 [Pseudocyphellaria aurata]|nr:hypothetical protein [Pseudocyphellaria aurata]
MASENATKTVNGNYGNHQSYGNMEQSVPSQPSISSPAGPAATGNFGEDATSVSNAGNSSTTGASDSNPGVPKDEVGWYFVEQYYTTLSKTPEKLHLFYSKRSQFVSGVEAEKVSVSVGQRAINERIKELDIQDCKVRVSNVDSQESFKNIVVQVIGEMSNKAAPHRKFVQTFVLAEQPNGYFVLNDIFRYINEEEEEEPDSEEPTENESSAQLAPEPESAVTAETYDSSKQQVDAAQVDKKLEEEVLNEKSISDDDATDPNVLSGKAAPENLEVIEAEDAPAAAVSVIEEAEDAEDAEDAAEETEVSQDVSNSTDDAATAGKDLQPEKPKDPDPTPVASPPAPAKATPAPAPSPAVVPKPAAPKTWANLVAANRATPPAIPNQANSASSAPSIATAVRPTANRSVTPPVSSGEDTPGRPQQNGNSGWQTAGPENGKRQGRQQSISGGIDKDNVLGYVKNVTERVDASLLKSALLQYGKLVYFDVSRQKNCAFVEFADATGYNNAVAANPHTIGGEQIFVEERRPRPNAYGGGYSGRGPVRGGRGGTDARPGSQGRGNYPKDGGRGGFTPRGRGGSMTPRGRGQPQAA